MSDQNISDVRSEAVFCDAFIETEGNQWAGTYCKLPAGHDGPCSPHYPRVPDITAPRSDP